MRGERDEREEKEKKRKKEKKEKEMRKTSGETNRRESSWRWTGNKEDDQWKKRTST